MASTSRQASFIQMDDNNSLLKTPDARGSQLPASDRNRGLLIDATPSGEVQMRVTIDDQELAEVRNQDRNHDDDSDSDEIDEQRLREELAKHREAEQKILEKLRGNQKERFSQGRGDMSSIEEYPGMRIQNCENGRLHQEDLRRSEGPVQRPCIDNLSWKASLPSSGTTVEGVSSQANGTNYMSASERCGMSASGRNRCVDTNPSLFTNNGSNSTGGMQNFITSNDVNTQSNSVVAQTQRTDVRNLKPKRPSTYDGTTSLHDHLVQFDMIALKNKWDDETKAYELATSLKGEARGIISDMDPIMRLNYTYLVNELTTRFEPTNQDNMYKAQMNSIFRKQGQSLPELAQEIKRITRLAYPKASRDIKDQLAKDCFIRALDAQMQLTLFNREPNTIGDCVRIGVEFESFVVNQKRQNAKPGIRMQYEVETQNRDDNQILGQIAKVNQKIDMLATSKPIDDKTPPACYYCGIVGHFKKTCRKYLNDKQKGTVRYANFTPTARNTKPFRYTQGTQTDAASKSRFNPGNY